MSVQDRSSTFDFVKSNENIVKEHQIGVEAKRLLRERLKECVLQNHENANEKCLDLRLQYVELLKDRYSGFLFPKDKEPESRKRNDVIYGNENK